MGSKLSKVENKEVKHFQSVLHNSKVLVSQAQNLEENNDYNGARELYISVIDGLYDIVLKKDKYDPLVQEGVRNYLIDLYSKCEDLEMYMKLYLMNNETAQATGYTNFSQNLDEMKNHYHKCKEDNAEAARISHNSSNMSKLSSIIKRDIEQDNSVLVGKGTMTFHKSAAEIEEAVLTVQKYAAIERADFDTDLEYVMAIAKRFMPIILKPGETLDNQEVYNTVFQILWAKNMRENRGYDEEELGDTLNEIQHFREGNYHKFEKTSLTNEGLEEMQRCPKITKDNKPSCQGKEDKEEKAKNKIRESIQSLLVRPDKNIRWTDIIGQSSVKKMLSIAIEVPIKRPEYLELNYFKHFDGILLFGPPGTGKSMLGEAVANEAGNFYFMKPMVSDLMSKWMGESEKYIKTLFEVAKENSPCIVFIDEIDGLMGSRDTSSGSAGSRIISELLIHMQHLGKHGVFVIGATNNPWSLDAAFFRRFNACFHVSLPNMKERVDIFKKYLKDVPCLITSEDFEMLGMISEKYSSAHISRIAEQAKIFAFGKVEKASYFRPSLDFKGYWTPCLSNEIGAKKMIHKEIKKILPPPITLEDVEKAIFKIKPQVDAKYLKKLHEWTIKNGQEGEESSDEQ